MKFLQDFQLNERARNQKLQTKTPENMIFRNATSRHATFVKFWPIMVMWQDSRGDTISKIVLKLPRRILITLAKIIIMEYPGSFSRILSMIRGVLPPHSPPQMPLPVKDVTVEWIFKKPMANYHKNFGRVGRGKFTSHRSQIFSEYIPWTYRKISNISRTPNISAQKMFLKTSVSPMPVFWILLYNSVFENLQNYFLIY